jgi:hypothetical protein
MAANLRLNEIRCETQDDYTGSDQPYLLVKGRQVWSGTMRSGTSQDLDGVPAQPFTNRAQMDLYEYDTLSSDDHLGTQYAAEADKGHGQLEAHFGGQGAHYVVYYEVV